MIIRIRSVTKVYKMGDERIHALAGVDLDVAQNEWLSIMGASGSGKSTLMNILGCLDRPTSGTYQLDGQMVSRMSGAALANVRNDRIGFVFQSFELMPRMSALKNVELPLIYGNMSWLARRRAAKMALERVGLGDRITHRPNQLSGGQKQRVAIARAMASEPAILLADEPTGNLDSTTTLEILELFQRLHDEGQTILTVTHEEDVASRSKRIVRMSDGRVISDLPRADDDINRRAVELHRAVRAAQQTSDDHSPMPDNPGPNPGPNVTANQANMANGVSAAPIKEPAGPRGGA